jgi:transposase
MSRKLNSAIAMIGIDIGKNSFHVVGLDKRGAIVLRQKWSRGQVEARLGHRSCCPGSVIYLIRFATALLKLK